jgi:diguanylate cyclase (GGDEF)-like protein
VDSIKDRSGGLFTLSRLTQPFTSALPATIRRQLIALQFERLHALVPLLYLTIAANAVAMALAVRGELPLAQQLLPPGILILVSLWQILRWRKPTLPVDTDAAYRALRGALLLAVGLGIISGLWCVSAFRETEKYRCVVAPVFIALSALVSANCLTSVPRAAIAAMVTALTPIVIAMLLFDDMGLRAMAVMLVIITALQSRLVQSKFRETIKMLQLQHDMGILAETDPLTGLKNRRVFAERLESALAHHHSASIMMIDLDGFKLANDRFGHQAGDVILIEAAARMERISAATSCIARLGGDEFAILFQQSLGPEQACREAEAIRTVIGLPYAVGDDVIVISASIGMAHSPPAGASVSSLLQSADVSLYADKAARRANNGLGAASKMDRAAA